MSTERNGIGDGGSAGIDPYNGDITPGQGGGGSGAPAYTPWI